MLGDLVRGAGERKPSMQLGPADLERRPGGQWKRPSRSLQEDLGARRIGGGSLCSQSLVAGTSGPMGGAQVQSLTPTSLKHFGPLKGWGVGWGVGGLGPKNTPFFEPPRCPGNIHTHTPRYGAMPFLVVLVGHFPCHGFDLALVLQGCRGCSQVNWLEWSHQLPGSLFDIACTHTEGKRVFGRLVG